MKLKIKKIFLYTVLMIALSFNSLSDENDSPDKSCLLENFPEKLIKDIYLSCNGVTNANDLRNYSSKSVSFDVKIQYVDKALLFKDILGVLEIQKANSCLFGSGPTLIEFLPGGDVVGPISSQISQKDCLQDDDYFHCSYLDEDIDAILSTYFYRKSGKYSFVESNRVNPSYYSDHSGSCELVKDKNIF
jgi:hypothetical protein